MIAAAPTRVGYLLSIFPKLSEVFVLNEVVTLQGLGIDLLPLSLTHSRRLERVNHTRAQQARQHTHYLVDGWPRRLLADLAAQLASAPHAAAAAWRENLLLPILPNASRVARFLKAVSAAHRFHAAGVRHVHAHWTLPTDVAMLVQTLSGLPFSFTAHAHEIFEDDPLYERQRPGWGIRRKIARSRLVTTCAGFNAEYLRERFPDLADRVRLVYHGIDLSLFSGRPAEPRPLATPPTIISVGRLVPTKGFDQVVAACGLLHAQGVRLRCLIVGDGPERERLAQQVAALGLEGVVDLVGARPHHELARLYAEADVYACASDPKGEYGLCNVALEAMAMELGLVIAYRAPDMEYVRDGENALVYRFGDVAGLARHLHRLITDETMRRRLAANGRRTVEVRFDLVENTRQLARLFATVGAAA